MEKETIGCMKEASQSRHLSSYRISNFGATIWVFKFNGFLLPVAGVTRFPTFLKQKQTFAINTSNFLISFSILLDLPPPTTLFSFFQVHFLLNLSTLSNSKSANIKRSLWKMQKLVSENILMTLWKKKLAWFYLFTLWAPSVSHYMKRNGGLSALFHSCGFGYRQRVLKRFPDPSYFCSEDGVV